MKLPVLILIATAYCAVSLIAAPPTYAQTPDAQTLLDRWADAIGGKARLAEVHTGYSKSTVEMAGMTGTSEEWFTRSGQTRSSLDLGDGVYTTLAVLNGTEGWSVDHNGKLQELQGAELESHITSSYLSTYSQFFADRMPGTVEDVTEDSSGANWLIKLTPSGGYDIAVALDKETYLPEYYVTADDSRPRYTFVSDWREVDGILLPFAQRQTTGDPHYEARISTQVVHINPVLAGDEFERPADAADDFKLTNAHEALNIPFELVNNHIYLQGTLNGKHRLWFIFDTGAAATALNGDLLDSLGIQAQGRLEGRGTGEKSVDVALIKDGSISLPGVELWGQTIMAVPLRALQPYEGRPIQGIIGYDLISRFVVKIDYAQRIISLYDKETFNYTGAGTRMPITLQSNHPHISCKIKVDGKDSIDAFFAIDTGARGAVHLTGPYWEANQLGDHVRMVVGGYGAGLGGEAPQMVGRIPALRLGNSVLTNVVAGFSQASHGAMASAENSGLIGGEILKRFTVILDYERLEMILEPNESLSDPFEYDMSGVFLATTPDFRAIEVRQMVENSAAAKAGLQKGDIITHMNDHPIGEHTLHDVRLMFKEEGRSFALKVKRGDQTLDINVKLERII